MDNFHFLPNNNIPARLFKELKINIYIYIYIRMTINKI